MSIMDYCNGLKRGVRLKSMTYLVKIVIVSLALIILFWLSRYYNFDLFFIQHKPEPTSSPIPLSSIKPSNEVDSEYTSENLKFSVTVPEGMSVDERFTDVLIISSQGEVRVSRVGTNFDTLELYVQDLGEKNKVTYKDMQTSIINGYDAVHLSLADPNDNSRIISEILIFVDGWVYKLSTTDNSVRSLLKRIAGSFKYRP